MASPQLRGCGVHALPMLLPLLLLLLLLLPLRVTPGRERLAPEQGSSGGPQRPAELDPCWGVRGGHIFPELSQESGWRGSWRVWGIEEAGEGEHVEGNWESSNKRVAPGPALGWLPGQACKGVERPHRRFGDLGRAGLTSSARLKGLKRNVRLYLCQPTRAAVGCRAAVWGSRRGPRKNHPS